MAIEAWWGCLRLRYAAADEVLSCSRRTKASTSALVTKITCSSTTLAGGQVADRLSALGVTP